MKEIIVSIGIILALSNLTFAQDQHGDDQNRARNDHSGNLIRVTFHNHGMLGSISGDQSLIYAGEWPINSGMVQMGNASSYVMSELRVFVGLNNNGDSTFTLVTPAVFCQGWDPNRFSHDSLGNFLGFEPLPGFYNLTQKELDPLHAIAMSHEAFTWPSQWPDKMDDPLEPGWPGHWNGYFGKDQKNSDQESYYVMDDYQFKKKVSGYSLPLPIPSQPDRGGLGLRQDVRGLQWSNPDAEDCIFWIYYIRNISELNHVKTLFGLNVGASMGAKMTAHTDWDDDCATFYREIGLTVNYDWDNVGTQGYTPVPWAGFAFLESPGNAYDGIDNDGDAIEFGGGKIISQQDFVTSFNPGDPIVIMNYQNYTRTLSTMPVDGISFVVNGKQYIKKAGVPLEEIPRNGIDDNLNGLIDESDGAMDPDSIYFYLYIRDPIKNKKDYLAVDYFTGMGSDNTMIDERRDDGIDNDGDWDPNIDDVGLDGKPATGDPGEGDGLPTPGYGDLPGESNIDKTDKDESDQIGLTSFIFYEYGAVTYSNDEDMWEVSQPGFFDGHLENVDADYIFSCGYFPLLSGQSESFSVAMIYGWDEQDIVKNKNVVQQIYDSNYNFAVAPDKPNLRAEAGDRKVTLYWNSGAEESFDRFLREYDFEGYKIYRATDPGFIDAGQITDGYGYDRYTKPLVIYDKVDSVYGFFPKSFERGVQFNLGSETGLVHTFVDSPVVNGQRYYYAVTAYDKGDVEKNISPSETNKFVTIDAVGNIDTGPNVVAIIPNAPALGYLPPDFSEQPTAVGSGITMAEVAVRYVVPDSMKNDTDYEIQFLDQSMDEQDNDFDGLVDSEDLDEIWPTQTTGLVLKNLTNSVHDTLWFYEYRYVNDEWILIKDLYDDNDGNPYTLKSVVRGLELFVYNPPAGILDIPDQGIHNGIQWSKNLDYETAYHLNFQVFNLGGFVPGTAYPRQYQIVFYDDIVGQSNTIYAILKATGTKIPLPARDINFRIFDKQTGEQLPCGFVDSSVDPSITPSGHFSAKDNILFYETLPNDSIIITFNVLNNDVQDTMFFNSYGRILGSGDTLNLYPDFPFTSNSRYLFSTTGHRIDAQLAKNEMDEIRVVPNPYVVTASWEPVNPYSSGRGPRSIHFINLPQKCTIRIFAIDGTLIETIEHNTSMTNGAEDWDVLSKDGLEIAYGVYIYHINAPGIGEKVGRMLIIK